MSNILNMSLKSDNRDFCANTIFLSLSQSGTYCEDSVTFLNISSPLVCGYN